MSYLQSLERRLANAGTLRSSKGTLVWDKTQVAYTLPDSSIPHFVKSYHDFSRPWKEGRVTGLFVSIPGLPSLSYAFDEESFYTRKRPITEVPGTWGKLQDATDVTLAWAPSPAVVDAFISNYGERSYHVTYAFEEENDLVGKLENSSTLPRALQLAVIAYTLPMQTEKFAKADWQEQ